MSSDEELGGFKVVEGLNEDQLSGAVEALLFVTDEPVGVLTLAQILDCEPVDIEQTLVGLRDLLEKQNRGIQLREVAGGWRFFTHPAYHELIEKYVLSWDTRKLSAAAMETLAIVAYTQPVTRSGVAQVRGVNSDSAISSLVEKGLLREMGTADTPGNPMLYGTTKAFLEKFGLRSVADLPNIGEFAPDDETRRLISERLSATRQDAEVSDEAAFFMAEEMKDEDDELSERISESEDLLLESGNAEESSPMDEMFRQAIASTLGVVDKIDFDELKFDFDEE